MRAETSGIRCRALGQELDRDRPDAREARRQRIDARLERPPGGIHREGAPPGAPESPAGERIGEIRGKAKPASMFEEEYGAEVGRLRQLVRDITHQKHRIELEHRHLEEDVFTLRGQREREARGRSEAESDIVVLKRDIDDAYRAKLQLDKKAQALVEEIHFLNENHEAEVCEMFDQIQNAQVTVKEVELGDPGVTAALRDLRAQLESQTVSGVQQMGESFKSQFARLTEAAESKRAALKATQREIQENRRNLQAKDVELDCAKGTQEALEKQLHELEDRHEEEMIHYQVELFSFSLSI